MRVLEIAPLPVGWSLAVSDVPNPQLFRSGAAAEASARRLALRLAAHGEPAKLVIRLRDGSIGGRFLFPPAVPEDAAHLDRAA